MTHVQDRQLERARRAAIRSLRKGDVLTRPGSHIESAEHLKARAQLMNSLRRFIQTCGMTQHEAADFFGMAQSRISDLVNIKVDKFSADLLINLHARAGMKINFAAQLDVETEDAGS